MIKTRMQGTKATVTRTLTLPKTGVLKEKQLEDEYVIDTGLTSKDAKTDVGKAILKNLPKVLDNGMNAVRAKYDNRNIKIWTDVGAALGKPGLAEKDAHKLMKAAETKIAANWNEYSKKIEGDVKSLVTTLAASEERKSGQSVGALKVKFSSKDLKSERVGILEAILGALTFGAVASTFGWIGAGLSAVLILAKGYNNAWKIAQKQSTEIQTNLNQIDDGLSEAQAALKKIGPYVKLLNNAQKKSAAQIITARGELEKMQAELNALEKRAKTESAVREGGYLKQLREGTQLQFFKLEALKKTLDAQADLDRSVKAAQDAVKIAADQTSARRSGWNGAMAEYNKVSKDSTSLLGAIAKLAKKLA